MTPRADQVGLEHLPPPPSRADEPGPREARARAVARDVGRAIHARKHPLEGGQRPRTSLSLQPDGRAPDPDGRADPRAVHGRLALGLSEDEAPDLRVDLPLVPARGSSPVTTTRTLPARSWSDGPSQPAPGCRTSASRRTAPVSSRASVRARTASYVTVPRTGTPRTCAVSPDSSTRETPPPASRSTRQEVATGAERDARDLDPLPPKLPARAAPALAGLEREPCLEALQAHLHAGRGSRQGASTTRRWRVPSATRPAPAPRRPRRR